MQTAASRLYILLLIVAALIQSALPHIDHPITAAHLAQGIHSFDTSPHPNGFLEDIPTHIQPYPLFQQLLRLFYHFGDYGLVLLHALITIPLILLLLRFARPTKRRNLHLPSLSILALTTLFISSIGYWTLTPQITALLFTTLTTLFLITHRSQADWLSFWPLILIQTLWNYTNDWYWIGLTLITIFSIEMILRESFQIGRWSLLAFQNWWPVTLLSVLTLLLAPHTWKTSIHLLSLLISGQFHLYPLEIGTSPWIYNPLFSFAAALIILLTILNIFLHYGQTFWSLAILAFCFGWNTLSSDTYTPLFLLLTTLTLFSSSYLGPRISGTQNPQTQITSTTLITLSLVILTTFLHIKIHSQSQIQITHAWQRHHENNNLIPKEAAQWIQKNASTARILHSPQLTGHLILHGLTPSQTTLTPLTLKYSPDTRRKAFLLEHRPTTLPLYIQHYRPDYILVDLSNYAWIPILRQLQFRPILATHNSTLWTQHPEHPTADIATPLQHLTHTPSTFIHETLLRILTLAAADYTDLAWEAIQALPASIHTQPEFLHALNIFSFHLNPIPPQTLEAIQEWIGTLPQAHPIPSIQYWHAQYHLRKTEYPQALSFIQDNSSADTHTLLTQIYLAMNKPEEAQKEIDKNPIPSPFNPRQSIYTARTYIALGKRDAAAQAYQHAITYAPEDLYLRHEIESFLKKYPYPSLRELIQHIEKTPLSIPSP